MKDLSKTVKVPFSVVNGGKRFNLKKKKKKKVCNATYTH